MRRHAQRQYSNRLPSTDRATSNAPPPQRLDSIRTDVIGPVGGCRVGLRPTTNRYNAFYVRHNVTIGADFNSCHAVDVVRIVCGS